MIFLRRHWRGLLASVGLTVCGLLVGIGCWAGSEIASPPRRALMDYHREYLDQPAKHGFHLDRFTASDGTPCLVCTPDYPGLAGDRGIKIRRQLQERGLMLDTSGRIAGTLVLLHGRKGRKEDYLPIAERLCAVGFRCVIPDLPAHGDHPAQTVTYGIREAGLPERVLGEAAVRFNFDPSPAGLLGMSMGGAVAVHAAALPGAPWKALVVISSFDALSTAIETQATLHAGSVLGPLLAKSAVVVYGQKTGVPLASIQPRLHASELTMPTFIAHGDNDHAIPITSGQGLFSALPANLEKRWTIIPGADHDNVLITSYPIYADIAEWMIVHVAGH